jgi:CRP-like cAMP-binding protein
MFCKTPERPASKTFLRLNRGNLVAGESVVRDHLAIAHDPQMCLFKKTVKAMHSERLFRVLSAIHPLSENFRVALEEEIVRLSLPPRHSLLEAGAIADRAYFLETGYAMSYALLEGERQVEHFWSPGQFVIPVTSFFEQVPSTEFIKLLEQSDVLVIGHTCVLKLFDLFAEANHIQRVIMSRYYEHSRERIRNLQHLNGAMRYKKLRVAFPRIEQLVSQEDIASYLGIAPQSLSRIKKQIERS